MGMVGLMLTKYLIAKFDILEEEEYDKWEE